MGGAGRVVIFCAGAGASAFEGRAKIAYPPITSLASTNGPSMTLILRSATRTRAPVCNGISPPFSIKRPALISRSEILATASISAGLGVCIVWGEVMIYMKRMQNSCWASCGEEPRKIVSLYQTTIRLAPDRHAHEKLFSAPGNNIPDRFTAVLLPPHHD